MFSVISTFGRTFIWKKSLGNKLSSVILQANHPRQSIHASVAPRSGFLSGWTGISLSQLIGTKNTQEHHLQDRLHSASQTRRYRYLSPPETALTRHHLH